MENHVLIVLKKISNTNQSRRKRIETERYKEKIFG